MNEKLKKIWNKCVNYETVSYLICGVLTTILNYVVYFLCLYPLAASPLESLASTIANTIAWIVAVIFAFFVNKIFVFRSKVWTGKAFLIEFWAFIAARLLSFGFETLFMFLTVDLWVGPTTISPFFNIPWSGILKIIANVFVMIMNYFASKFLIFAKKEDSSNGR